MKKMFKRLTAALLMLTMVFGLAACSLGGPKDDNAFLKNLKSGLEARWKFTDKLAAKGIVSVAEERNQKRDAASKELEKLGMLAEYQFNDADLQALAERYYEALNNQVTGAKYYEADDMKFNELYVGGLNERCMVLSTLVNDYQFAVSPKQMATLDELVITGEKLLHIQSSLDALTEQLASATMEHTATGKYKFSAENTSDMDLESVNVKINGLDADGQVVTTGETYLSNWNAGTTASEEIYFESDFASASVMLSFYYDIDEYSTEYVDVAVTDDLVIDIQIPTLPMDVNDFGFRDSLDSTCRLESVTTEEKWYEGKCSMKLLFSGTKTFDTEGDNHSDSCQIGWKLYDENNAVVDSGTCYTSDCTVGEQFRNAEISVYDLEIGTYRLEILDYKW